MRGFKQDIAEYVAARTPLSPEEAGALIEIPRDPKLGDLAFPCFRLSKQLRKNPAAIAAELAEGFSPTARLSGVAATGAYLNFHLDRPEAFAAVLDDPAAGLPDGEGKTVVLDYGSPNISKQLAYHHLPSASIGFSLKRIFEHLGYRAVGINHLGDWGTSHGKLIEAWKRWGDGVDLSTDAVAKLNGLYVRINDEGDDGKGAEWFRKLEEGDPEARALWQRFRDVSLREISEVYDLLGITFDEVRGESDFVDDLEEVVSRVEAAGLATMSEGALVVDLGDHEMPPFFLRKSDGATVYGTRDLAAALHRYEEHHFSRCLYVVDMGQSLYFKQLFLVLRKLGLPWADSMEHVDFGVVTFGGKKTATRTGNVVLLRKVVEEAIWRIGEVIHEKNPDLANRDRVARDVGVGAIIFSYLSSRRQKDFDFVWEDVLNFEGHTGPYVQYTHARCASILRKSKSEVTEADLSLLTLPEEWETAKLLGQFPDRVRLAARDAEPSVVAQYLLSLCEAFSTYYNLGNEDPAKKVLAPDPAVAAARLRLVSGVRAVLERGLGLLGINAPEEM